MVIENGIIGVTLSIPGGDVIGIKYKGIDNVLEIDNEEDNRGYLLFNNNHHSLIFVLRWCVIEKLKLRIPILFRYWDVVWNKPGDPIIYDKYNIKWN